MKKKCMVFFLAVICALHADAFTAYAAKEASPDYGNETHMDDNAPADDDRESAAFSSRRLLVGASDGSLIREEDPVVSSWRETYLLRYDSAEEAQNAYAYFEQHADFVSADTGVTIAEKTAPETESSETESSEIPAKGTQIQIEESTDALTQLADAVDDAGQVNSTADSCTDNPHGLVAVIDTGMPQDGNVIEYVSMIGDDTSDENGHGTAMLSFLKQQNSQVQVMSIKALDKNGNGDISAVYAGIEYALTRRPDIILLPLYAINTGNAAEAAITAAAAEAEEQGTVIVGAAGNDGADASGYIPGCIDRAIIVGACDETGKRTEMSNYGNSVDYFVLASSTSEASARMAGFLSLFSKEDYQNQIEEKIRRRDLIFRNEQSGTEAPKTETKDPESQKPESQESGNQDSAKENSEKEDSVLTESEALMRNQETAEGKYASVSYLLVKADKIGSIRSIDDLYAQTDWHEKILTQISETQNLYKTEDGRYQFLANLPWKNGIASSSTPVLDYCFARSNNQGMVISEHVSFDTETGIATVEEAALSEYDPGRDFCDIQLQVMLAVSGTPASALRITFENTDGSACTNTVRRNMFYPVNLHLMFQDDDGKNITAEDMEVYLNDNTLPTDCFSVMHDRGKTFLCLDDIFGRLCSIRIVFRKSVRAVAEGADAFSTAGGCPGYVKTSNLGTDLWTNASSISNYRISIVIGGVTGYQCNTYDTAYGNYGGKVDKITNYNDTSDMQMGYLGVGSELWIYDDPGYTQHSWGTWTSGNYSHGFKGMCCHVSKSVSKTRYLGWPDCFQTNGYLYCRGATDAGSDAKYKYKKITFDIYADPSYYFSSAGAATGSNQQIATRFSVLVAKRAEVFYQITTKAEPDGGGSIDPTITGIKSGEKRTVNYKPNKGWYIDKILSDNWSIPVDAAPASYNFSNIRMNHSVYVHFSNQPVMTLMKKVTGVSDDKSIDGRIVKQGSKLRYTLTYLNNTSRSETVTITDTVPSCTSFESAEKGGRYSGGAVTWDLGNISAYASGTVSFVVSVKNDCGAAVIPNQASASVVLKNTEPFSVTSNRVVNYTIATQKKVSDQTGQDINGRPVAMGQKIIYAVSVKNTTATARDFVLTDVLPEHMTYVSSSGAFQNGKVTWRATLDPNQELNGTVTVCPDAPGRFSNSCQVTADDITVDSNTVINDVYRITVHKKASDTGRTLKGAGFILRNDAGRYYRCTDNIVSWTGRTEAAECRTDDNGNVYFSGMEPGRYTLIEVTSPQEYTVNDEEPVITVNQGNYDQTFSFTDHPLQMLPNTGGPGIAVFIIIAAALAVISLLICRKKSSKKEKQQN